MRDLSGKSREELEDLVREQDLIIECMTGELAAEVIGWYKTSGKAVDEPLRLAKTAKVELVPILSTATLRYPQPRGWPKRIRDRAVHMIMMELEEKITEVLFGEKADRIRAEREAWLKQRARGGVDAG